MEKIFLVVLIILSITSRVFCQTDSNINNYSKNQFEENSAINNSQITSECILFLSNGTFIKHAHLRSIENDSLIYIKNKIEKKILLESLNKIIFESDHNPTTVGIIIGALAGGISGYFIGSKIWSWKSNSSFETRTYETEGMIAGLVLGAALGTLISSIHSDKIYDLSLQDVQQKVKSINKIINEHRD